MLRKLYLLFLFLILPLYAPSGYVGLGEAKARLYIVISVLFAGLFLIHKFVSIRRDRHRHESDQHKLSPTRSTSGGSSRRLFFWRSSVLLLILSLLFSSLLSGFFTDAWSGADGWRMGFLTQSLSLFFAFAFSFPGSSHKRSDRKFEKYCLYTGGGIAMLLGIANRFQIYPFSYMKVDSSFLSTLGNIDWFCGYLSVLVPIIAGDLYLLRSEFWYTLATRPQHFYTSLRQNPQRRFYRMQQPVRQHRCCNLKVAYQCYFQTPATASDTCLNRQHLGRLTARMWMHEGFSALSFLILILLGVESSYLILGVCFLSLALVSVRSLPGLLALLEQVILFCLLPGMLHLILFFHAVPLDSYLRNNPNSISWELIQSGYGLALLIALFALLLWCCIRRKLFHTAPQRFGRSSCFQKGLSLAGIFFLAGVLLLLMSQVLIPSCFPDEFGSFRGLIWKTCAEIYHSLPTIQKLFGIGPDCLYRYLLEHPIPRNLLLDHFGIDMMNAHSVLLQRLLTTGLIGTLLYLSVLVGALRILNQHRSSLPFILMILSTLVVGTVLFEQISCFPLMMLLLGSGLDVEYTDHPNENSTHPQS